MEKEKNKIDAELNRSRVAASQKNVDRLTVTLEKGTIERIQKLGYKGSAFARAVIMKELETLEKISKKTVN